MIRGITTLAVGLVLIGVCVYHDYHEALYTFGVLVSSIGILDIEKTKYRRGM